MKIESLVVKFMSCGVTTYGARALSFAARSLSGSPIDIQTSVYRTLASFAAASGSVSISIFAFVRDAM